MAPTPSRPLRLDRRTMLGLLGGAGLAALAGCATDRTGTTAAATSTSATSSTAAAAAGTASSAPTAASCDTIPAETAGPFPGDGSNGPDYLAMDGAVREDIRPSIGSDQPAPGTPTTVALTVVDVAAGCTPLAGAAVYAWHCDATGRYSMYDGAEDETFCRGVQVTDDEGRLSFRSIFPGCYPGRWPHVHFEVYRTRDEATGGGRPLVTSQLALPADTCAAVYASSTYGSSRSHLDRLSLETDGIFADGYDDQLATMSGDPATGLTAALTVGV